jgi:peptidoglycan/xylan/chitin deacetylase (PgdA/CDA1 family)
MKVIRPRKIIKRVKRLFVHKAVVLMYHRVADIAGDPWELAVHPVHFEQHLQLLKSRFRVIAVSELVRQLQKGALSSDCVCITFDDGYSDNFVHAKPLLEKYQCPATFFIATNYINHRQLFWWDELQHLILDTPVLPPVFSVVINNELVQVALPGEQVLTERNIAQQLQWVAPDNPPTKRCELYLLLWQKLKPLPHAQIQQVLDGLRSLAGNPVSTNALHLPMTETQLQDMARHSLFDIGLHTVTHPSLSIHSREVQNREIINNAHALRTMCRRYSNIITYPYGDYNSTTIDVVRNEKLDAAFTTEEHSVTKKSDRYCLGRFQVKNWNGPAFEKQVATWIKSF